jgi:type II secretory pathway pseudopilin PulG
MAALLVGMAVMGVLMTIALPVWRTMTTREKEAELIFRGEQWARGIALYQRKHPGAFPPTLDVLVQQRFVRRDYKDPITKGEFQPLYMAQAAGGRGPAAGPGAARGAGAAPGVAGGSPAGGQPGGQAAGRQAQSQFGAQAGAPGAVGAIIGVVSKSPDASMMVYKGRTHYNEWQFLFSQVAGRPGTQGAPGGQPQPGMGRPGQGRRLGMPGQGPRQGPRQGFPRGPGGTRPRGPGGVRRPGQGPGTFQPRRPGGGPGGS